MTNACGSRRLASIFLAATTVVACGSNADDAETSNAAVSAPRVDIVDRCHVDLASTQGADVRIEFQVHVEDASTTGPKHDDFAINGSIKVLTASGSSPRAVTASLRAYCVSARLGRDAAYSPAGRRCAEHDVAPASLVKEASTDARGSFAGTFASPQLFESVDAPGGSSRHVLYELHLNVDGGEQWDPIGDRGGFRFDFQGAFEAQGKRCL